MSSSIVSELFAYRRERFPLGTFVPLALALTGVAALVGGAVPMATRAVQVLLMLGLLFQFRLWDDLCDRTADRAEHPQRVLVRTTSLASYWALLLMTAAANLLALGLIQGPGLPLVGLVGLNAALFTWYHGLRPRMPSPVLNYHVVLLKYPAFVALLAGPAPALPLATALALVYFSICIHEFLHDCRLHALPSARAALVLESSCWLVGCAWLVHLSLGGTPS